MIELKDEKLEVDESPLKKWREKFENKTLSAIDFAQYFQSKSKLFYPADNFAAVDAPARIAIFDDETFKEEVIDVIEEFLCGTDPRTVLKKIKEEGNVSAVCGRVFKSGEPTYSCRECGMDPTCVLCVNCFKQSEHRHHKYKMSTSSGGGCCDCGDHEAWRKYPVCIEHCKSNDEKIECAYITQVTRDRSHKVIDAILQYAVRILTIESEASLRCLDDGNINDDLENMYCAILYNDETHTFEQVIQTLIRTVGSSHKDAIEYVSNIDREGRAVVKFTTFPDCLKIKADIEKQSLRSTLQGAIALKVAVLHRNAVGCQYIGIHLLTWLQDFLTHHEIFRHIFCDIIMDTTTYNLSHIIRNDCKLWKTARTAFHRLLISGMLMEYHQKVKLAIAFTRYYPNIMQDFIRDDHDHSVSIASLSVQLFTVPSIAQQLIATESGFFKLMLTFYSQSIEQYVKKQTVQFAKNTANLTVFKRAAFILFDLRYLLSFKPAEWSEELRLNFLHGLQTLVQLLKEMQGMDSVFRQTGQHMEYEPEWEAAFNLHIKLAHVITLVLEWCSTDKRVLQRAYRLTYAALLDSEFIVSDTTNEVKELADHSVTCYMYDVASKPVSIHLPLSRFFAGLYLQLSTYNLKFEDIVSTRKLTPELIIEPVLCTQTMIAQVHAGLWRRNGYSLLNQLYFYRNVKCRSEMLDRDIVILQMGASLIESNEFVIHLLNKFNLVKWARPDFELAARVTGEEESIRQLINMIDEFLELLIVIVGERFMPGVGMVTDVDRLKHEVIQQLCIKAFSHSELSRALPDTQHELTHIESIIQMVADFQKPTQSDKKGVYELKPQYYVEYNLHFYHYSKEDRSKSEETQTKRRKDKNELACCPPPMLPRLEHTFMMLTNLLQCDVTLSLMQLVLKRANDLKSLTFVESHLQKILYLIGYAVQEELSSNYPYFKFLEISTKWGILPLIEELVTSVRVEAHRDLIIWTIKRYKDLIESKGKPEGSDHRRVTKDHVPSSVNDQNEQTAMHVSGETVPNTATSNLIDNDVQDIVQMEKIAKEQRSRLAAERREQIMAQMTKQQNEFMSSNVELFEKVNDPDAGQSTSIATGTSTTPIDASTISVTSESTDDTVTITTEENATVKPPTDKRSQSGELMEWQDCAGQSVCLGPKRKPIFDNVQRYTCILCSEESLASKNDPFLVYAGFIQESRIVTSIKAEENAQLTNEELEIELKRSTPHVSTCGHVMHGKCWESYFENEVLKENRRPNRTRSPNSFIIDKQEYLCPLCRCLSNTAIPIVPPLSCLIRNPKAYVNPSVHPTDGIDMEFNEWFYVMKRFNSMLGETIEDGLMSDDITYVNEVLDNASDFSKFKRMSPPACRNELTEELKHCIRRFLNTLQLASEFPIRLAQSNAYLNGWASCSYTIQSIEMYLNAFKKPLRELSIRHSSGLSGLIRICGTFGDYVKFEDIRYLNAQLNKLLCKLLDEKYEHDSKSLIINVDLFHMLLSLVFMTPMLLYHESTGPTIAAGFLMEFYYMKLAFITAITRAILLDKMLCENNDNAGGGGGGDDDVVMSSTIPSSKLSSSVSSSSNINENDKMDIDMDTKINENDMNLLNYYNKYNLYKSKTKCLDASNVDELIDNIKKECMSFLRSSCLLFRFITDIEFSDEFLNFENTTFEVMCTYLNLNSNIESYFQNDLIYKYMKNLALSVYRYNDRLKQSNTNEKNVPTTNEVNTRIKPEVIASTSSGSRFITLNSTTKNSNSGAPNTLRLQTEFNTTKRNGLSLVDLPEDYSDLINSISTFTCPNNTRDDSRNPTMCLVCGITLCSMTYCCQRDLNQNQVGACTYHATSCGAGIGLFLRIRDCEILILGMNKGCFMTAPYLDEYGESDQGLRRGNPLRLCKTRYDKIKSLWLNHGLHEEVSRTSDNTHTVPAQWHHL